MASVLERIGQISQPYGGYVKLSDFERRKLKDDTKLNPYENIHGSLVGSVVEYLTRLAVSGKNIEKCSLEICLGAEIAEKLCGFSSAGDICKRLLAGVKKLNDDASIVNACKAVTFALYYRNPIAAMTSEGYEAVNPDKATIENIRTMVIRSYLFFKANGPITAAGFNFGPSGYSKIVDKGDGDFLTSDTLWDMKVYRGKLTKIQTLQILMYWIMGLHSGNEIFNGVHKIGLYNPRMNVSYLLDTSKISRGVIEAIEKYVICY